MYRQPNWGFNGLGYIVYKRCVTKETPILCDDLTWKPAGDLEVGDGIIGFDEYPLEIGKGNTRKYRTGKVTNNSIELADVVEIELENGKLLYSTPDHPWLANVGNGLKWIEAKDLVHVNHLKPSETVHYSLPKLFDPWATDQTYDAGYIAGVYDGEGSLDRKRCVLFAQTDNEALYNVERILSKYKFNYHKGIKPLGTLGKKKCYSLNIYSFTEVCRFLGTFKPKRLLNKFRGSLDTLNLVTKRKGQVSHVKVIRVTPIGQREIAVLSTDLKTHITDGYPSHNTYSRMINADTTEEWWQTVARCINGAQKIGAEYTQEEAERLYDLVFNLKCTFGGRMLWQLGTSTVDRFGLASLLACWWVSMRELEDFCFLFEHLMLGGGVGFSVKREDIHELPKIKKGVSITHILAKDADFIVPDSRQGWVELLRKVLNSYFVTGKSFTYSTILVRGLGEPIKGFGGTSSGPQILIEGLESIFSVFRGREGKKLRSVDVLDINNLIGSIVVAGNVRRCLPEYTLVHTDEGLQRIKNIKVGDRVLTVDGYKKVLNNFYQGKQNTVFVKTQDGSFECTSNHRMAVLKNLGGEYEWVEAQNLKVGDRLGTSRNICTGIQTYLPEWKYEKSKHSTTCQDIIIPELDSDMAWFLGIFQADGYTYPNYDNNGFNAGVSLVFNENEYSVAERAKQQLERFGLVNVVLKHRKNENSWMVGCQSKQIAWYLDKNLKQANTPLVVPEYILRANHKIRLAFVCGVMDGDGAANNRPVHVVTTVYETFAKEIQALLYSCGIESRLNEGNENTPSRLGWQKLYHVVLITNHSKNRVINCEMLEKDIRISSKTNYSNGYPSSWLIHGKRELGAYSNEQITVDRYERYSGTTPTLCPVEVLEVQMGNSQVETYDIEVEDVHEFFANGYLTHNSAQIAVGDPDDYLFIKAKNWADGKIPNWRDKSNNSINADNYSHISEDIWNNGYILDKKTGKSKGEAYGFINLPLCRSMGRLGEEKQDNCEGVNPSMPKGVLVATTKGIFEIQDLENKDFFVKSLDGTIAKAKCFHSGKDRPIYELTLGKYKQTYSTKEHKWPVFKNGSIIKVKTEDLKVGDLIPLNRNEDSGISGDSTLTYDEGLLIGTILGDGWLSKRSTGDGYSGGICFSLNERPRAEKILEILNTLKSNPSSIITDPDSLVIQFSDKTFIETLISRYGLSTLWDKDIPCSVWTSNDLYIKGFVDGLLSADGNVTENDSICLTTSRKLLAVNFSKLLSFYGIPTTLYGKEGTSSFPNKKDYKKIYQSWRVKISIGNINKFNKIFKLTESSKQLKIENSLEKSNSCANRKELSYAVIKDIKILPPEDVWDITVYHNQHVFPSQYCYTGNCAEITLADGEACNLCEIYLNNIDSKEELFDCARLLYKTQKAVWTLPALYEKTDKIVKKNRRIGLGITGICQSIPKLEWLDECYNKLVQYDIDWSRQRGWPASIKLTTVKPSGCVVPSTEIKTELGYMSMETIFKTHGGINLSEKSNERREWYELLNPLKVYDHNNELQDITKLFINGIEDTITITFEDEYIFECTPDHKILLKDGSWKKAKDLTDIDDIECLNDSYLV